MIKDSASNRKGGGGCPEVGRQGGAALCGKTQPDQRSLHPLPILVHGSGVHNRLGAINLQLTALVQPGQQEGGGRVPW
jgi:hypothetical protein